MSHFAIAPGFRRFVGRLAQAVRGQHALVGGVVLPMVLAGMLPFRSASAQSVFTFAIDGPQMETISPGTGMGTVTLDTNTGIVTTNCTYTGLMGDLLGVHIHGPALPFEHAPVKLVLDFSGTTSGTIFGTNQATPADVQSLLSGLYYVVLHTAAYGGGELRGQIVTPGATTPYGSGINPANSLVTLGGSPSVPGTLTLGIDNPAGSQSAPGTGALFLATQPDALFDLTGTGLLLPGFGMSGPAGELLIDAFAPNPFMAITVYGWAGAGNPLPVNLNIPNNLNLVGKTVYLQAVLFADSRITLTNALELYLGL
jgi:CHRD domain